jgi:hypothetical protein
MSSKTSLTVIQPETQAPAELLNSDLEFARAMKNSFDQAGAFGLMYAFTAPLINECLAERGGAASGVISSIINGVGMIPGVPSQLDYSLFQQGEAGKVQREIKEEISRTIQSIADDCAQFQADMAQIFKEEFPALYSK